MLSPQREFLFLFLAFSRERQEQRHGHRQRYGQRQSQGRVGERNSQRKVLTDRQIGFINKAVEEYREYFNELKKIYVTGIYSPCYAVTGWSQGPWYLDQLRKTLTASSTVSEFPYESNTATKNPTE